jgi:hypothetical protein
MGCDSGLPNVRVIINSGCDADDLTPAQFTNCMLNQGQTNSQIWANAAQDWAGAAVCSAKGLDLSTTRDEKKFEVTAEEPEIPSDLANSISQYNALKNQMIPLFGDTFDDYFDRNHAVLYNPAYTAAASWLVNVISNGVSGIPVYLENQIYGRIADRIRVEAALARQRGINRSSSLGWKLPNPAIISMSESEALAGYRELGAASTRIGEKQVDIQIDSVKFAVTEANRVYLGMEANAIGYLNAFTSFLNHLKDLTELDPNVKSNYINAVANLYGQRIKKDQVQWMSLNDFYQRVQGDNQLRTSNSLSQTDLVVKANTASAEVMKMLAAAVLSQLSTMVTTVATG